MRHVAAFFSSNVIIKMYRENTFLGARIPKGQNRLFLFMFHHIRNHFPFDKPQSFSIKLNELIELMIMNERNKTEKRFDFQLATDVNHFRTLF